MKRLLSAALLAALSFACLAPASAAGVVYPNSSAFVPETVCSAGLGPNFPIPCGPTVGDTGFTSPALASGTAAKIVSGVASESIRVTYLAYSAYESATGGSLELLYGTGSNCGTGTTVLHIISYVPATTQIAGQLGSGYGQIFIVPAGKDLCAEITAGTVTEASVAGTVSIY